MGAITIRKLDDAVVARLKARAKAAGRSMEEEARQILSNAAGEPALRGEALIAHLRGRRKEVFGDRAFPSSVDAIREIRDEDPTLSPPDAGYR